MSDLRKQAKQTIRKVKQSTRRSRSPEERAKDALVAFMLLPEPDEASAAEYWVEYLVAAVRADLPNKNLRAIRDGIKKSHADDLETHGKRRYDEGYSEGYTEGMADAYAEMGHDVR